jgi:hypothetical protein
MPYILDSELFAALLQGRLKFASLSDENFLATDEQLRALRLTPDQNLSSKFRLGRPSFITDPSWDGDGRDAEWDQNGPEFDELAYHLQGERHQGWEADLAIIEVALNERAVLVSDRENLRALVQHFEGRSIPSPQVLQR